MFSALAERWAVLPTWALMILLGNPSPSGSVSWPLLPKALAIIGGWLPPGASINAQHTAVYFYHYQHPWPFMVLAGWSLLSVTVY
ncbi:MAG: ABC transporter permease, partial [Solirubrobacterales bacterium]|nr:ABC transporter permease [Solirubrobacterales bacterium]